MPNGFFIGLQFSFVDFKDRQTDVQFWLGAFIRIGMEPCLRTTPLRL
jgi:hypothetical protein